MTTSLLPAFGWTNHSEQVGADALAARAWQLKTGLLSGCVLTAVLQPPPPDMIPKLERIAAAHLEHRKTCVDPMCETTTSAIAEMCPGGKFDPTVLVFHTVAFDAVGTFITELRCVAFSPEEAIKNHYGTCALLTGALTFASTPEAGRA